MNHKRTHRLVTALLALACCLATGTVHAQQLPHSHLYQRTWYDAFLKSWNPNNINYGDWLEQRRQALLDATVNQPQFWYSLSVTVLALLVVAILTKRLLDAGRKLEVMEVAAADAYSHDLYSREAAKEATQKYNAHMEQCNRAFEAAEAGDGRLGWGDSQLESVKAELQRVSAQLEATTQERNKLQEELRQKAVIVSDLSLRLDALSRKINANAQPDGEPPPPNGKDNGSTVVGHINRLQEELYAERQKNKRLKAS